MLNLTYLVIGIDAAGLKAVDFVERSKIGKFNLEKICYVGAG